MEFEVLLFASLRDRAGRSSVAVELAPGATVADLRAALAAQHPAIADGLAASRIAVSESFAEEDDPVPDGAEVAVIPPVSGG